MRDVCHGESLPSFDVLAIAILGELVLHLHVENTHRLLIKFCEANKMHRLDVLLRPLEILYERTLSVCDDVAVHSRANARKRPPVPTRQIATLQIRWVIAVEDIRPGSIWIWLIAIGNPMLQPSSQIAGHIYRIEELVFVLVAMQPLRINMGPRVPQKRYHLLRLRSSRDRCRVAPFPPPT